ncbi:hypothetical protein [Streptomyces sp. NPDC093260]|uniref:hypothetical protein n=1 Tax=Streptomyces sp. NPDC093260 TaxID=3155073 RepID=UPI00341C2B7F
MAPSAVVLRVLAPAPSALRAAGEMVVVGFVKPAEITHVDGDKLREVFLPPYARRERHKKGGGFGALLPERVDVTRRSMRGVAGQQRSPGPRPSK